MAPGPLVASGKLNTNVTSIQFLIFAFQRIVIMFKIASNHLVACEEESIRIDSIKIFANRFDSLLVIVVGCWALVLGNNRLHITYIYIYYYYAEAAITLYTNKLYTHTSRIKPN